MCSTKNSPTRERPKRAMTKKSPPELLVPTKPRRRRPKTRKKPKYLSLKLELSAVEPPSSPPLIAWMPPPACKKKKKQQQQKQKRDPLVHDEDHRGKGNNGNNCQEQLHAEDQQHVALLFETATDGTSTTLDGLLHSSTSEERDPISPSISCVYSYGIPDYKGRCGTDGLLRSAIRCKEREASVEERWVSYNEVVEAGTLKREHDHEDEDASSNCGTGTSRSSITEEDNNGDHDNAWAKMLQLVGLKLDKYQDILDVWSDKPPFCFPPGKDPQGDRYLSLAQIVPDLHLPGLIDNQGSAENVWRVPDVKQDEKSKEKDQSWKIEQREASVLRYKEKRQNRLFSKRIRYEVRKVNAEKRPRLKGRFVKKNEGT